MTTAVIAIPGTRASAQSSGQPTAAGSIQTATQSAARGAGNSVLTVSAIFERVSFGTGILESDLAGGDTVRIKSGTGLALPIQFSTVLGGSWLIDAGTSFTTGKRTNVVVNASDVATDNTSDNSLSGVGDIRVRVSRRFDNAGLRVTLGANIPTGITELDEDKTGVLSVLGSPALGLTQPAVGFGAGATLGVVKSFTSASRLWGVAVGASMEWRGEYEPYAALAIGQPIDGYDPGEVVRVSAGATRLFGESKGLITASLDLFGTDKVSPVANATPVEVRIGPTFTLDASYLPATTAFTNTALYASVQSRAPLERDGTELEKSGNMIIEAGARGARGLAAGVDLELGVSARAVTALEIDDRLATASSTSVAPTIGLAFNRSSWSLRPAVTARFGSVDTGLESAGFSTIGARLTLARRF